MRHSLKKSSRNVTIEYLRFLFAGIVVLHHSRYILGDDNCWFLGGSLAVEFFLFVSGYLLLASAEKKEAERDAALGRETLHFILHKLQGFYPEFLIAWLIGFGFVGAVQHKTLPQLWTAFLEDFWELTLVKMSGLFQNGIDGAMWYLSAMLLSMAILYPLLRRWQDVMTHLVCPLLAMFLYGFLCRGYGHPRDPAVWLGFFYKGFVRTFAGLCTGVVIRIAVRRLQKAAPIGLTGMGNAAAGIFQAAAVFLCIRYMALRSPSRYDYFYMFLLMLLVLVTFAGMGIRLKGSVGIFLGRWSLPLYLGHLYFAQHINEIPALAGRSGGARMAIYLLLSAGNSLVIMALAGFWRSRRGAAKRFFKRIMVKS